MTTLRGMARGGAAGDLLERPQVLGQAVPGAAAHTARTQQGLAGPTVVLVALLLLLDHHEGPRVC